MNPPTDQQLLESLASNTCPVCGKWKERKKTLCGGCYFRMPQKIRSALYRELGNGYAEAVNEVLAFHHAESFRLSPSKQGVIKKEEL